MVWLLARKEAGKWRVGTASAIPPGAVQIAYDNDLAEREATRLVRAVSDPVQDIVHWMEWAAFAYMHGRPEISAGLQMAEALKTDEASTQADELALKLPPDVNAGGAAYVANAALAEAGLASSATSGMFKQKMEMTIAALAAPLLLLLVILRHGGSCPDIQGATGPVIAVHPEMTTRARPAIQLIHSIVEEGARPQVLMLGRPTASVVNDAQIILGDRSKNAAIVRPLSFAAWLRALPAMVLHMAPLVRAADQAGFRLPFRELLAIAYRGAQGAVHAKWWTMATRSGKPECVLFGHTGTADTSGLERAMQAGGTQTVHLVHGTNLGTPFAAISNIGLFRSGYDARLGASLPAYGATHFLPNAKPALGTGNGRWTLLTSYTHPLNPAYARGGPTADIATVNIVAKSAEELGMAPSDIYWRPHPMLQSCDPVHREALEKAVEAAGFKRWPDDLAYEAIAGFGTVITTPSTVLTDALQRGVLPLLAVTAPLQDDLVYNAHAEIVRDADTLVARIRALRDEKTRQKQFDAAWEAILPGADLTPQALRDTGLL